MSAQLNTPDKTSRWMVKLLFNHDGGYRLIGRGDSTRYTVWIWVHIRFDNALHKYDATLISNQFKS